MAEDPLLKQIASLQKSTGAAIREQTRKVEQTTIARATKEATIFARFLTQVWRSCLWIWSHVLGPVLGRFYRGPVKWVLKKYITLWNLATYKTDQFGGRYFSVTRGAGMVVGTAAFLWFLLMPILDFGYYGLLYALTVERDEKVYLYGSQELDHTTNSHNIEGCQEPSCTQDDAIYYRAERNAWNEVWSLTHGHGRYFPEYVAAAVPYAVSECIVTTYGFRFRITARWFNIYPYLLTVRCVPAEVKPSEKK